VLVCAAFSHLRLPDSSGESQATDTGSEADTEDSLVAGTGEQEAMSTDSSDSSDCYSGYTSIYITGGGADSFFT
jgi:hypothetical protein